MEREALEGRGQKRDRGDEDSDGDARQDRGQGKTWRGCCRGDELRAISYIYHRQNSGCQVRSSCHPNAVKVVAGVNLGFLYSRHCPRFPILPDRWAEGEAATTAGARAAFPRSCHRTRSLGARAELEQRERSRRFPNQASRRLVSIPSVHSPLNCFRIRHLAFHSRSWIHPRFSPPFANGDSPFLPRRSSQSTPNLPSHVLVLYFRSPSR